MVFRTEITIIELATYKQ